MSDFTKSYNVRRALSICAAFNAVPPSELLEYLKTDAEDPGFPDVVDAAAIVSDQIIADFKATGEIAVASNGDVHGTQVGVKRVAHYHKTGEAGTCTGTMAVEQGDGVSRSHDAETISAITIPLNNRTVASVEVVYNDIVYGNLTYENACLLKYDGFKQLFKVSQGDMVEEMVKTIRNAIRKSIEISKQMDLNLSTGVLAYLCHPSTRYMQCSEVLFDAYCDALLTLSSAKNGFLQKTSPNPEDAHAGSSSDGGDMPDAAKEGLKLSRKGTPEEVVKIRDSILHGKLTYKAARHMTQQDFNFIINSMSGSDQVAVMDTMRTVILKAYGLTPSVRATIPTSIRVYLCHPSGAYCPDVEIAFSAYCDALDVLQKASVFIGGLD